MRGPTADARNISYRGQFASQRQPRGNPMADAGVVRSVLWMRTRPFMEVSTANRRNQVLGECRQLKSDVDSYNERRCPDEPIQISFDFTIHDLASGNINHAFGPPI